MPPKAKKQEPSKKTEAKKKDKVIEDKTFGLKNKKGSKQQKFIQHVVKQVQSGGSRSAKDLQKLQDDKYLLKDQKKKQQEELNALFQPVQQKIAKGADPKSVLCAFFKQGNCAKGEKCKFSHDLAVARKSEKRSMYDDGKDKKKDGMDDWDEAQLEEVINQKHGEKNKSMPKTSIVCKFFLEAVENSKYGWFWICPNGDNCIYKHQLPAGFILKKDKKKMEEQKENEISLEELIEKERAALSSKNLTKVTLHSFLQWKERKRKEKIAKAKAVSDKKKQDYKAGKMLGISGRDMFEFNPELVGGDDDDASAYTYRNEAEDVEEAPFREIVLESLSMEASEVDGTGTVSKSSERKGKAAASISEPVVENGAVGGLADENLKLDMAAALPPDVVQATDEAIAAAMAATIDEDAAIGDMIDENLFDGEDLDLVEEELETLELDD